jgi:protein SCO1/2
MMLLGVALSWGQGARGDDAPPRFDTGALDNGQSTTNVKPAILDNVGIDQHLNGQLPMDAVFTDDTGKTIKLGDLFGKRPVLLQLIQFSCQNLCTLEVNGLCRAANGCLLQPGTDYDIVTISFDARETTALGAAKKHNYISQINKPNVEASWHFLTGPQASIDAVTQAVGFRYVYDKPRDQFVHSGALFVVTPDGRLSKYLYGAEYAPDDLRLAVADAGAEKIGTLSDAILLFCFHYDPESGKYTVAVRNLLRAGAVLTMTAVGLFMGLSFRRDRLAARRRAASVVDSEDRGMGPMDDKR